MRYLDRDGIRLAWNESGSGAPVLLIMGHRYSSRMWYPVFASMGERFHLAWFDNRGTGGSGDRANTSVEELTADALAVLDAAGIESAHIYGVSMGGGLALEFAIRYPHRVRSLVLGCTTALTADKPRPPAWLREILYRLPASVIGLLQSKKFKGGYGDAATDEAIARDRAVLDSDPFSRRGILAQARAIAAYSVDPEDVRKLTMPALVLHGTQDTTVPYAWGKALSELLPNATLVTFEGCGHNYFVGAGERANEAVIRFIEAQEASLRLAKSPGAGTGAG